MAHVHIDIPEEDLRPDVLREALAGRLERLPPSAALAAMAELDIPPSERQALMLGAIDDTKLAQEVRAAAVRMSMRMGLDVAGPALLKALESSDERVAAAAATALGQLGTEEHLAALKRRRKAGDILGRRVAFAEALIVHRLGVADHEIELPAATPQVGGPSVGLLALKSVRPGPGRRARALAGIKREFPQLDLPRQDVHELQCGPRLLEIAVDPAYYDGPENPNARNKRPGMPAIVAIQDVEYDDFYPRWLLLSRPTGKDRGTLMLTTLTGDPVAVGEGSMGQGGADLELRAAKAPGAVPFTAHVRLRGKMLDITGASDRRSAPARSPKKM